MTKFGVLILLLAVLPLAASAQTSTNSGFKLAFPNHRGQLSWSAEGFKIIESSAKPNGVEIGIRARDESGRLTFLGFLFIVAEKAPLTSAECRDGAIESERKGNSTLKILGTSDNVQSIGPPVSIVSYTAADRGGKKLYSVRAFVVTGDTCGDLEFYSNSPISAEDTDLKRIFATYRLDDSYVPKFKDAFLYAQILYNAHMYKAAAPIFEMALTKLNESPGADAKTMRRVMTDQAGMAYGMSGDIAKARATFEKAVAEDPDYPLYYYNLACADAEEKNLAGARNNLQKAFDRKANVMPGESMPDPMKDDSFLPYHNN